MGWSTTLQRQKQRKRKKSKHGGKKGGKKGSSSKGKSKNNDTCRLCGQIGHWGNECPSMVNSNSQGGDQGHQQLPQPSQGNQRKSTASSASTTQRFLAVLLQRYVKSECTTLQHHQRVCQNNLRLAANVRRTGGVLAP